VKGARFKEEQIIAILNQVDRGTPIKEICRQHGIVQGTIYRWKAKFGGMQINDAKKLRALEAENSRLKRMVADMALDIQILRDVNSKKW
jgi:putative transposase